MDADVYHIDLDVKYECPRCSKLELRFDYEGIWD